MRNDRKVPYRLLLFIIFCFGHCSYMYIIDAPFRVKRPPKKTSSNRKMPKTRSEIGYAQCALSGEWLSIHTNTSTAHTHVIPIIHVGMNVSTSYTRHFFFFFVVCMYLVSGQVENIHLPCCSWMCWALKKNRSVHNWDNWNQHLGVNKK